MFEKYYEELKKPPNEHIQGLVLDHETLSHFQLRNQIAPSVNLLLYSLQNYLKVAEEF